MAVMNQSIDLSQLNLEEMIMEYGEEETVRLMNIIIENVGNVKGKTRKSKKETRE